MTWYLIMLVVERKNIVDALASLLKLRGESEKPRSNFWVSMITYAALFGTAVLALWLGLPQRILNRFAGGAQGIGTIAGGSILSNIFSRQGKLGGLVPIVLIDYGFILATLIVAVSCVMMFLGLRQAFKTSVPLTREKNTDLRKEAAEVVGQTISSLETTKEFHGVIVECYRKMCKILADTGLEITPTDTAREFSANISTRLSVGNEAVRALTFLFEEARYSNHDMREETREEALSLLNALQQALSVMVA
jgi:hypothetical protein